MCRKIATAIFCIATLSCTPTPTAKAPIMAIRNAKESGKLELVFKNLSTSSMCIPARLLNSRSGSIGIFQNNNYLVPRVHDESLSRMDQRDAFFVVPGGSEVEFQFDLSQFDIKKGKYKYSSEIYWYYCDEVNISDQSALISDRTREITGEATF